MDYFDVLLVGTDINAYYMARNFHEAYGIISNIIGKVKMNFTSISSICNVHIEPDLWDNEVFKMTLSDFGKSRNKKIILIGTNDTYVRMIVENAEFLSKWYVFNYVDIEILDSLLLKDNFYKKYQKYNINIPKTYNYSCRARMKLDLKEINKFDFPLIVKPSNSVRWAECKFHNQSKVYKVNHIEAIQKIVAEAETSGYDEELLIQEYIEGDDTHLFDSVFYCQTDGTPLLQSFAQIGLQEYSPTGIGNCTVLINGYNQWNNTHLIKDELKKFLVDINYRGIAEFDLKYDPNRKKFYVLEINPRQARSSYYLTACGYNLAKYLVEDLILGQESDFVFISQEIALTFVPSPLAKKYIKNIKYIAKLTVLSKKGKLVNPLDYENDNSIKRKLWFATHSYKYFKKYKNNKSFNER